MGERGGGGGGFEDRGERRGGRDEDPNAGRSEVDDWRRGPPPETRGDDRDRGRYNGRDSYDRDRGGRDRDGGRGFSSYEPPRDRDGGRYGGFSRDGGRDGYSRDGGRDREPPKERPKLALAPRSKPKDESDSGATQSNIFGGAKPVDTVKKEKEIEEKLQREKEEKERAAEEARKNKPSAASIFGGAKPVDTTQREKEIEDKISKLTVGKDEKKEEKSPVEKKKKKPPGKKKKKKKKKK